MPSGTFRLKLLDIRHGCLRHAAAFRAAALTLLQGVHSRKTTTAFNPPNAKELDIANSNRSSPCLSPNAIA
jgi:hypothetical protein